MKKLISLLLAVLLVSACFSTAFAEGTRTEKPTFSVGTVNGQPGSQVVVPVTLEGDYAASLIDFSVNYDPDMLTLVTYAVGSVCTTAPSDTVKTFNDATAGTFRGSLMAPWSTITGTGTIVELTFTISGSCTANQTLTLTVNDFNYMPLTGGVEYIDYDTENGAILLPNTVPVKVSISDVAVVPGETFTVDISIDGNYMAHSITLQATYDTSALTYVSYRPGSVLTNRPFDAMPTVNTNTPGTIKAGVICPTDPITESGVFLSVTFTVNEGCTADQLIDLSVIDLYYFPITSPSQTTIPYEEDDGVVTLLNVNPVSIEVESCEAEPGDTISVSMNLDGKYAASGMNFEVLYDSEALTLVSCTPGEVLTNRPSDAIITLDTAQDGKVLIGMLCPSVTTSECGVVATFTFTVSESCHTDQTIAVNVTSFIYYPLTASAPADIPYEVTNGTITIASTILYGDVNCDGEVTMADVSALIAYIMNSGSLTAEGLANADANHDGTVDILDATAIYSIAFSN